MKNTRNIIITILAVIVLAVLGFMWNSSRNQAEAPSISGEMQNASSTEATSSQPVVLHSSSGTSVKPSSPSTGSGSAAPTNPPSGDGSMVVCTMDAKICPDGTGVGRTGPKCEFAACPGESSNSGTSSSASQASTALNQTVIVSGVYITPTQVVSDSRCPSDVTCVWAGEVKLSVHLEKKGITKEVQMTSGGSVDFQGSTVSLVDVQPQQKSKSSIYAKDYSFTFLVK